MLPLPLHTDEPTPERLFVWGLVESIDLFEDPELRVEGWLYSIDAMVTEYAGQMPDLSPHDRASLRRIEFIYSPRAHSDSPVRGLARAEVGSWVRLRITAQGFGALCRIEGPFPGLMPSPELRDGDSAPLHWAWVRWGRPATDLEQRRLTSRCLGLIQLAKSSSSGGHPPSKAAPLPGKIRIVDVGQAHCAEIYDRSTPGQVLGYFDVGKPLNFFTSTWPVPPPALNVPDKGFVILSHWDYDHYSMALAFAPSLLKLDWIAPIPSSPGPTAAALIATLGPSISLVGAANLAPYPGLTLHKGLGPAKSSNNSGYVLRASLPEEEVLLAGDVEYKHIAPGALVELSGLLAPHHGAKQLVGPPAPLGGAGRAVFSFGHPNSYSHPDVALIAAHSALGWATSATNWIAHPLLAPAGAAPLTFRQDLWF